MILQALKEYYDRKAADPESDIAPFGWKKMVIPFVIVLDNNGGLINIELNDKQWLMPQPEKNTCNIMADILYGDSEYTLGIARPKRTQKQLSEVHKKHRAFLSRVNALGELEDEGLAAIKLFLAKSNKGELLGNFYEWKKIKNSKITFKLNIKEGFVVHSPIVKKAIDRLVNVEEEIICLVTGESDALEEKHRRIDGVLRPEKVLIKPDTLIGFNHDSFNSFKKSKGKNAPVGKKSAFAYVTALNTLLAENSRQKLQVGDATTVFWSAKQDVFEDICSDFFEEPPKDDPDRLTNAVVALYESVNNGVFVTDSNDTHFYVLGLSPNAARISVRFWYADTIAGLSRNFRAWFDDLEIVHGPKNLNYLPLWRYLVSLAALGKTENIPHGLAGNIMRAILSGLPLPLSLLQVAILRNRAEQDVTYPRAALIKAALNRLVKHSKSTTEGELKVSLDTENDNIGYRLGRLFAVLGNVQHAALGGQTNTTIRDRYYGAASASPVSVFPTLLRNAKNHLGKLRKEKSGLAVKLEKEIQEILWGRDDEIKSGIPDFPAHLFLKDQGRFAIGYYHQRQDFFTKQNTVKE